MQAVQLAADPPRCFVLADGAELKIGGTILLYRASSLASKAAHRAPAPHARAEAAPESEISESEFVRVLEAESQRVDNEAPRDAKGDHVWKCRITVRNGSLAGKSFMFLGRRITIGRDKKSRVHLNDKNVSRTHACIWRHEGDVVIEDMKSGNGVFVNGVAVRLAPLKVGDVIRIGSTEFLVHL